MEFGLENIVSTSKYLAILAPVIVIGAYALAVFRSGSAFPILASAWHLIAGKRNISNNKVACYVQEQHDLASFQFFSGLRLPTIAHTTRLIDWAESTQVPIARVSACGGYFDVTALKVRQEALPSKTREAGASVLIFVFLALTAISLYFALSMQNAFMSFRDNGRWFAASELGARTIDWNFPVLSWSATLDRNMCSSLETGTAAPGTSFSASQTKILCGAFGSKELRTKIDDTLASQKFLALFFSALFVWLFWKAGTWLRQTITARKLMSDLRELELARQVARSQA